MTSPTRLLRRLLTGVLAVGMLLPSPPPLAVEQDLPVMGDAASGIISRQQEHELGRAWLRAFRSRVETLDDPVLQSYVENLLYDLVVHSELQDRRLELILINNPSMNAFAVPGGVIGLHTGLFRFAENEDQLASVVAHELAHLSQRHFARRLEAQKKTSLGTMAGLLAGIILAATAGGDAGMAAMTMTQAAALESQLRYSRQNEQEADRQGMRTLYESGRDPGAVAEMFERMMAATRYTGRRPPEFLLTHPLTEKRVADARNRINNYPARQYPADPRYAMMRARAQLHMDNSPQRSIQRFSSELEGHSLSRDAARYGLALALSEDGRHQEAWQTLQPLLDKEPENLVVQLAAATLESNRKRYDEALARLEELERLHRDNYALLRTKAEVLLKASRYQASERILETLSRLRPNDPEVWFQLAEVSGLAGDITGVHKARAEYYILTGVFDKAREQLQYAQRLVQNDFRQRAVIEERLRELKALEERTAKL